MKKNPKITFRNLLSNSGLGKEEYESIIPAINEKNYTTLLLMSFCAALIMFFLSLVSFFFDYISKNTSLYLSMAIIFSLLALSAWFIVRKKKELSLTFIYIMLFSAYAFGIIVGTFLLPDMPATSFIVLLFAVPLLLIDRPFRCSIMNIIATACFCVCSYLCKTDALFIQDLFNSVCFMVIGIAVNTYFMHTKLRDLLNRNYIEHERDTDALTKLLNYTAGSREIKAYLRNVGNAAALLIFDIDDFKYYNDTFGHTRGDSILSMMGDAMRAAFRGTDTLVRMGGDEFIIFLPNITGREQIDACLERLNDHLLSDFRSEIHPVTISVGAAMYPHDSEDYNELYGMADKALYVSKRLGKNRTTYYSDCQPDS